MDTCRVPKHETESETDGGQFCDDKQTRGSSNDESTRKSPSSSLKGVEQRLALSGFQRMAVNKPRVDVEVEDRSGNRTNEREEHGGRGHLPGSTQQE